MSTSRAMFRVRLISKPEVPPADFLSERRARAHVRYHTGLRYLVRDFTVLDQVHLSDPRGRLVAIAERVMVEIPDAELVHGERRTYARGCRCAPCKAAHSEYQREYSRAWKAGQRGSKPKRLKPLLRMNPDRPPFESPVHLWLEEQRRKQARQLRAENGVET